MASAAIINPPGLGFWIKTALFVLFLAQVFWRSLSATFGLVLAVLFLLYILYQIVRSILSLFTLPNLDSRAVFITGCDSGFGKLLALKCLKRGMPVFAGCLTQSGADTLSAEAEGLTGKLYTVIVNVADEESVKKAVAYLDKATEQYGGLHGVVNNAGVAGQSFYDDWLTVKDYEKVASVNTFGVIRVTQMTKHLVKKTRGRIVTVTSITARMALPGIGPYVVSKFAISGYCEVLRQELRYFGVSVHILEPGFFKTPLIDQTNVWARLDETWKNADETVKKEYGEKFFFEGRERASAVLDFISSPHVEKVVDAYFHALTARFPKLRYRIGNDANYFFYPITLLGTSARDSVMAFIERISGAPVPAVARNKDGHMLI